MQNLQIITLNSWHELNAKIDQLEMSGVEYNPEYLCIDRKLGIYQLEILN